MELPSLQPDRLVAEQIRNLYAPVVTISFSAMLSVVIIAGTLWPFGRHPTVLLWVGAIALCQLAILALSRLYHRLQPPPEQARRWGVYKAIYSGVLGACWSIGAVFLYDPGEPRTGFILALGIAAPTAVSLSVNAYFTPNMHAFILASILPFTAYLVWCADPISSYLAIGLTVHLIFLTYGGAKQVAVIQDNIRMRLEMADLAIDHQRQADEAREARAQAEAASAAKSLFFGAASHDLRQPLNALGLYVSLLRKNPEPGERSELLGYAANCVDSLNRLFNAILGVSSADEARQWATPVPVSLRATFERVRVQFGPLAETKGLRLRVAPTRSWVYTDPEVLERILNNLVENAIRYTETGGVLIGVRRDAGSCRVVVVDTGIGIDMAQQKWIFDDFRQVGNPARDRAHGFGLGLATVRRLCSAMDYALLVRSEPGRGSSFSVSLPPSASEPAQIHVETDHVEADLDGVSVLLVEDDELVRDAMQRLLSDWGVACRVCDNSKEVIDSLRAYPARTWHVLLDYRLGDGENGLDIADRILESVSPAPRITVITGEIAETLSEEARRRGISLLRKPLKPLRLRATLAQRRKQ